MRYADLQPHSMSRRASKFFTPHPLPPRPRAWDEAALRRDLYGMPGPLDRWLQANRARAFIAPSALSIDSISLADGGGESELLCKVYAGCEKAPDDGSIFRDDDHFTLHMVVLAPSTRFTLLPSVEASPVAILDTYAGASDDLEAPDWASWAPERAWWFRQPLDSVSRLFEHVARKPANESNQDELVAWARGRVRFCRPPGRRRREDSSGLTAIECRCGSLEVEAGRRLPRSSRGQGACIVRCHRTMQVQFAFSHVMYRVVSLISTVGWILDT